MKRLLKVKIAIWGLMFGLLIGIWGCAGKPYISGVTAKWGRSGYMKLSDTRRYTSVDTFSYVNEDMYLYVRANRVFKGQIEVFLNGNKVLGRDDAYFETETMFRIPESQIKKSVMLNDLNDLKVKIYKEEESLYGEVANNLLVYEGATKFFCKKTEVHGIIEVSFEDENGNFTTSTLLAPNKTYKVHAVLKEGTYNTECNAAPSEFLPYDLTSVKVFCKDTTEVFDVWPVYNISFWQGGKKVSHVAEAGSYLNTTLNFQKIPEEIKVVGCSVDTTVDDIVSYKINIPVKPDTGVLKIEVIYSDPALSSQHFIKIVSPGKRRIRSGALTIIQGYFLRKRISPRKGKNIEVKVLPFVNPPVVIAHESNRDTIRVVRDTTVFIKGVQITLKPVDTLYVSQYIYPDPVTVSLKTTDRLYIYNPLYRDVFITIVGQGVVYNLPSHQARSLRRDKLGDMVQFVISDGSVRNIPRKVSASGKCKTVLKAVSNKKIPFINKDDFKVKPRDFITLAEAVGRMQNDAISRIKKGYYSKFLLSNFFFYLMQNDRRGKNRNEISRACAGRALRILESEVLNMSVIIKNTSNKDIYVYTPLGRKEIHKNSVEVLPFHFTPYSMYLCDYMELSASRIYGEINTPTPFVIEIDSQVVVLDFPTICEVSSTKNFVKTVALHKMGITIIFRFNPNSGKFSIIVKQQGG